MKRFLLAFVLAVPGCGGARFTAQSHEDGGQAQDSAALHDPDSGPAVLEHTPREAGDARVEVPGDADGGSALEDGSAGGSGGAGGASSGGRSATGGGTSTGGTHGSGGSADDGGPDAACALIVHANGFGQTWQDCVPLGTWSESQAMKACVAYTGDAGKCTLATGCGVSSGGIVRADYPTYTYSWVYSGSMAGKAGITNGCTVSQTWD